MRNIEVFLGEVFLLVKFMHTAAISYLWISALFIITLTFRLRGTFISFIILLSGLEITSVYSQAVAILDQKVHGLWNKQNWSQIKKSILPYKYELHAYT